MYTLFYEGIRKSWMNNLAKMLILAWKKGKRSRSVLEEVKNRQNLLKLQIASIYSFIKVLLISISVAQLSLKRLNKNLRAIIITTGPISILELHQQQLRIITRRVEVIQICLIYDWDWCYYDEGKCSRIVEVEGAESDRAPH